MAPTSSIEESSWLNFLFYRFLNPLVETGFERQVKLEDTPELGQAEDTAANSYKLLVGLDQQERLGKRHPLLWAVAWSYWAPLLFLQIARLAETWASLAETLLTQQVIIFSQALNNGTTITPEQLNRGLISVIGLIFLGIVKLLYSSHLGFLQNRVTLRISSALRGTVLHRCVRGASAESRAEEDGESGDPAPSAFNIISFDIGPNVDIIWIILGVGNFPIQFASTMAVLIRTVGPAAWPGLFVIIIAKVLQGVFLVWDGYLRHTQLRAKDERLSRCAESFVGVRTLHMLSWTQPFIDRIMAARSVELSVAQKRLVMSKIFGPWGALDYSLPTIVTFVTLGYYVYSNPGGLKPDVAIPTIALVTGLNGPFGQFPVWANQFLVWRSAYGRVNNFMGLGRGGTHRGRTPEPAQPTPMTLGSQGGGGGGGGGDGAGGGGGSGSVTDVAAFQACTLTWGGGRHSGEPDPEAAAGRPLLADESVFNMQDLDLHIRGGDLLVLCGGQGQGKSSLLMGLLGEMIAESGEVRSPAILRIAGEESQGAVAGILPSSTKAVRQELDGGEGGANPHGICYAAQSVSFFAGTVRSNVLFGSQYDAALYSKVLKACALEADLATMPLGDLSEVSLGGTTLSGGQKARVGLARATYRAALARQNPSLSLQSPPLVLLDDVFCALDRNVARGICQELFTAPGGLLVGCAVIIASSDPWWVQALPQQQLQSGGLRILVMRSGRLIAEGLPGQMQVDTFPELTGLHRQHPQPAQAQPTPENQAPDGAKFEDIPLPEKQKTAILTDEEHQEEGQVKWSTYMSYINAVGPWTMILTMLILTSIMFFQQVLTLWVAYWTDNTWTTDETWWLWEIYGIFTLIFTVSNFCGHGMQIFGGIKAAGKIFSESLLGTFGRPFMWWDANPTGRVLNRFSSDVEVMDLAITSILGVIYGAVLYFVGHAAVLGYANPGTLFLLPFIFIGMEFYARFYRRTVREVQRILLISTSSVYQGMVEAIAGKVTVRAFAESRHMLCLSMAGLDDLQRADFTKSTIGLWIGLRMGLIGFTLSFWTTLQPVLQYLGYLPASSAALVGFSIEYSRSIVGIIQQFIMNFSDMEMQLISIERLREYSNGVIISEIADGTGGLHLSTQNQQMHMPTMHAACNLTLDNVWVTYRAGLNPALKDVTVTFHSREATALMGRTGAGKSSLLLAILQLAPYEGNITLGDHSLATMPSQEVRKTLVGVVPQAPLIFVGSLRWNLDPEGNHTDADLWSALQVVGLQGAANGTLQLDAMCMTADGIGGLQLSQSQQQLLCAARALLRTPKVVLLDEVTASLPAETAMNTLATLVRQFKGADASVLIVTHQDEVLSCCDRVVTVAAGKIIGDRRL